MRYAHTMVRVADLDAALDFYCNKVGLVETRRMDHQEGRFTLVYLAAPSDVEQARKSGAPEIELTYNWDAQTYDGGRNFGHLAYRVSDIHAYCLRLQQSGVVISRPPRDGYMAFIRSPDGISIEIIQEGDAQAPREPWISMPNTGTW